MQPMDWATLVMLVSAIISGMGLIPSLIQSLSMSKTETKRVETEKERLEREAGTQLATQAGQMASASAVLINDLQEETIVLRKRNMELSAMFGETIKKYALLVGHTSRLMQALQELSELHIGKMDAGICPNKSLIQGRLDSLIKKYAPLVMNGDAKEFLEVVASASSGGDKNSEETYG